MSFLKKVASIFVSYDQPTPAPPPPPVRSASIDSQRVGLSPQEFKELKAALSVGSIATDLVVNNVVQVRQDIKSWKDAVRMSKDSDSPLRYRLNILYDDLEIDGLYISQKNNRKNKTLGSTFTIKKAGKTDEALTELFKDSSLVAGINDAILETTFKGHSLIEFYYNDAMQLSVRVIPYQNVIPQGGYILKDATDNSKSKRIYYRQLREYGNWVLEFGDNSLGLLNNAAPHILFKKFAQSCWSELCEIYGIPPRYMKTNTEDPKSLARAGKMMKDMGSAAWFVIDKDEDFQFAKGTSTNGDVYGNLITLCNNETSMLVSGAIIGQDTVNGNRSKDESAQEMLESLVIADKARIQKYWKDTIFKALINIGYIPKGDYSFSYDIPEDLQALWDKVVAALPYYEIPAEWLKQKFGLEITGPRSQSNAGAGNKLSADFFA